LRPKLKIFVEPVLAMEPSTFVKFWSLVVTLVRNPKDMDGRIAGLEEEL